MRPCCLVRCDTHRCLSAAGWVAIGPNSKNRCGVTASALPLPGACAGTLRMYGVCMESPPLPSTEPAAPKGPFAAPVALNPTRLLLRSTPPNACSATARCTHAGTSLPDTIASRIAAIVNPTADMALGNMTCGNALTVFLGLGLPWIICSVYYSSKVRAWDGGAAGLWRTALITVVIATHSACACFARASNLYGSVVVRAAWWAGIWAGQEWQGIACPAQSRARHRDTPKRPTTLNPARSALSAACRLPCLVPPALTRPTLAVPAPHRTNPAATAHPGPKLRARQMSPPFPLCQQERHTQTRPVTREARLSGRAAYCGPGGRVLDCARPGLAT